MAMQERTILNLYAQSIKVTLWNGCFNKAVVRYKQYELTVEVTHPLLVWQCGEHKSVMLVKWKGCNCTLIDIPEKLMNLVNSMKTIATMTNEEAERLSKQNFTSFCNAMTELGIV